MSEELKKIISKIAIYPASKSGKVLANGTLFLAGGKIGIRFKLIDGKNGVFPSLPRHQGTDKNWYDDVYLPDRQDRDALSGIILDAYKASIANPKNEAVPGQTNAPF